ncbi:MAG TPA: hypothetical protein VKV02_06625 [Acidobacteriaceae bacterium]|nr:hypothetical protein [Acidobacteriaceae bacterium]
MAVQTTPHTNTQQDANSAQDDLDPNMNPQDTYRADPKLYENSDGAQTGGTRAFNANAERDNQPKSIDEGTGLTGPQTPTLPTHGGHGITSSSGSKERETQEKVINS